jgi:hypothetical protein
MMPEYVHHVRRTRGGEEGQVWCGATRSSLRWDFESIDHVAHHRQSGGRMLPCDACLKAICAMLWDGNE